MLKTLVYELSVRDLILTNDNNINNKIGSNNKISRAKSEVKRSSEKNQYQKTT